MCIAGFLACGAASGPVSDGIHGASLVSASVPDASRSSLDITPSSQTADGQQSVSITVRLKDERGQNVRGKTVQLAATGSGNVFQPAASGVTDHAGAFTARLLSTSAGIKTVTARAAPIALSGTVTFKAGPPSSARSSFLAVPARAANDGRSTATVGVVVRDAFGNLVRGIAVAMSIGGSSNVTVPAVPAGLTDANGTFAVALSSTAAEIKNVTAWAGGSLLQGSVEFAPDAISAWLSSVDTGGQAVVANGRGRAPVVVTLRDGMGRPVPNRPVALKASGSNNAFAKIASTGTLSTAKTSSKSLLSASTGQQQAVSAPTAPVTDSSGTASSSLASLTAETKTVSATADGVTIQQQATFISPPWVPLTAGLSGGWVGNVVAPPDGSLLASTGAGPYRSSDGRAAWVPADGGFAMGTVRLFLDPATGSVYSVTLDALYRSDDYGITWVSLAPPNPLDFVNGLTIDHRDPQVLYAAGFYAVYRSTDGGVSWSPFITPVELNPSDVSLQFNSFAIDPFQPTTFYLGGTDSMFVSGDAGGTWNQVAGFTADVICLVPDPRLPGRLFAGTRTGAYVSTDGGASWSLRYGDDSTLVASIVPDAIDADGVWLGPIGQGLVSLSLSTGAATPMGPAGVDAFNIADVGGRLLVSSNDSSRVSLYSSDDRGTTWAPASDGIAQLMANSVVIDPANPLVIYAAVNGVMKSTDGGDTWSSAADAALAASVVFQILIDSSTVYAAGTGGTYRSTDAGATWTLSHGQWLNLALDGAHPGGLYARGLSGEILQSLDSGTSWTFLSQPVPDGTGGQGIFTSPAEPGVVYLAVRTNDFSAQLLLRSQDGVSWTFVNSLPPNALITPDPATAGALYMVDQFGGPLFRSADGGATFVPVGDPPWGAVQILTLAIDPNRPDTIWVGNLGQMFRSRDGGATWVEADEGTSGAWALSFAFHPTDPDTVFAGTYGNGILRTRSGGILTGVSQ